jgi:hypothetical protein
MTNGRIFLFIKQTNMAKNAHVDKLQQLLMRQPCYQMASEFWDQVMEDDRISEEFKRQVAGPETSIRPGS